MTRQDVVRVGETRRPSATRVINCLLGCAFLAGAGVPRVADAQQFRITRVGLYDAAHTDGSGNSGNYLYYLNSVGVAAGTASRYNGFSDAGTSVWATDPSGQTRRFGLFDANHADTSTSVPAQQSQIFGLTGFYATGTSRRFYSGAFHEYDTWGADVRTGTTTRIGLYDSGYPNSATAVSNTIQFQTSTGFVAGSSGLANETSSFGDALWGVNLAGSGVTIRVGLWGTGYTKSNGQFTATLNFLTDSGMAIGQSGRYSGLIGTGSDVWVTSLATGVTSQLGFTGTGFQSTAATPVRASTFIVATASGYVGGWSARYSGLSGGSDQASWVTNLNTGTTTEVGLFGSEYGTTATTDNRVLMLTQSGYAGGTAARKGTGISGTAVWIANPGAGNPGIRVGLTTAEFATSEQTSSLVTLTETGYSGGHSVRILSGMYGGQGAWVANPSGSTVRVGLTGAANTLSTSGTQESTLQYVTNSGSAGGYSRHAVGNVFRGQDTWVSTFSGGTVQVGFSGGIYTASDGTQQSDFNILPSGVMKNSSGYVAGESVHYNGASSNGVAAWVAGSATGQTKRVGLTGTDYTLGNGYEWSQVDFLTDSGYAAGYSDRYFGSYRGSTAWVYNIQSDALSPIILSLDVSSHSAFSKILAMDESGLAVGTYTLYDEFGDRVGDRAFAWTPILGAFDLASQVDGGLTADQWTALNSAQFTNALGMIAGTGTFSANEVNGVYVLQPTPEPGTSTCFLLGAAMLGLARLRRRERVA